MSIVVPMRALKAASFFIAKNDPREYGTVVHIQRDRIQATSGKAAVEINYLSRSVVGYALPDPMFAPLIVPRAIVCAIVRLLPKGKIPLTGYVEFLRSPSGVHITLGILKRGTRTLECRPELFFLPPDIYYPSFCDLFSPAAPAALEDRAWMSCDPAHLGAAYRAYGVCLHGAGSESIPFAQAGAWYTFDPRTRKGIWEYTDFRCVIARQPDEVERRQELSES